MPPQSSGVIFERRELMGMGGKGKKEIGKTKWSSNARARSVDVFSRWLTNAELPHQQELVNALARQAREVIRDPVNAWTSIHWNREAVEAQAARIQALEAAVAGRDQMLQEAQTASTLKDRTIATCSDRTIAARSDKYSWWRWR